MKAIVKIASAAALAAALAAASLGSAHAGTYVFDFSGSDNSNTLGTLGNARTTTSTNGAVSVRATGWHTGGGNTALDAYLGAYAAGYGVRGGALDQHFVDSFLATDFIVLQFSRSVVLNSATFNTFFITGAGTPADSDATISAGYAPNGSWTGNLFSSGTSMGSVASNFYNTFGSYVTTNSNAPRAINAGGLNGNVWLIAAGGVDGNFDGFKLSQITATAVPEPATWALMILGFGAIGFAMRSRRAAVSKVSYAI